jgi:hypothetical protein
MFLMILELDKSLLTAKKESPSKRAFQPQN